MDDLIKRKDAIDEIEYEIEMINSTLDSMTLDFNARERLCQRRGEAREILNSIQMLPSAQTVDAVPKSELFELFDQITTAWNGKQRFFHQDDGTIYDRNKCDYVKSFEDAVNRFCEELEME